MEERKLNLQLFAEEGEGTAEQSAEEITYTQADMDAKLAEWQEQSKTELDTAQKAWEKEFAKKMAKEKAEAEKLATLSAEERAKAEFEKQKSDFESERAAFAKQQLEHEVGKTLITEKLDPSFASFLTGADAEESNENIKNFKSAFEQAVEAAVSARLKGTAPTAGIEPPKATYTREQIAGMSAEEINKNWESIKTNI